MTRQRILRASNADGDDIAAARRRGSSLGDPVVQRMLRLQAAAGNLAVAGLLDRTGSVTRGRHPAVQRQPPKGAAGSPAHVAEAQNALATLFPGSKLMGHVTISSFDSLGDLIGSPFAAWTESASTIYVEDPARTFGRAAAEEKDPASRAALRAMGASKAARTALLIYEVHHEAAHVVQFERDKHPPATWQRMMELEIDAYSQDEAWLGGTEARRLIPDADLRDMFKNSAITNRQAIEGKLAAVRAMKGASQAEREADARGWMVTNKLIFAGSPATPGPLYEMLPLLDLIAGIARALGFM
jgi:hypothetical protein